MRMTVKVISLIIQYIQELSSSSLLLLLMNISDVSSQLEKEAVAPTRITVTASKGKNKILMVI